MKKPDIYTTSFIVVFIVFVGIDVWIWTPFFPVSIDFTGTSNSTKIAVQTVPTVINGITTSMGIAVALGVTIIGVMFHDEYKADLKAKTAAIYVIGLLIAALCYPWGSYLFLATGLFEIALRYSLAGYFFALFAIVFAYLYGARRLGAGEKKTESDNGESDNPKPKGSKDKTVNIS